ncbi:hypothetical protein RhiirA4_490188 [Rhizophagus irregularis]|uniref:Uncharacterized protein n=1 Tax=Rhizophagus irregularis TaxID=588596 RepID=A0A2I1HVH4_9GLOM|nr:hypothetical protein RhiirA4_490188 [Rhizophagus irregularis]
MVHDFAGKLFIRCFADQGDLGDLSVQDSDEIISNKYLEHYNNGTKFRAFAPKVKLKSDESDKPKWYNSIRHYFMHYINKIKKSRNFEKSPIALQVVPFPGFTANGISGSAHSIFSFKGFLLLFIPRFYRISHDERFHKLSPFSKMIIYENNDDIYDNPAIEALGIFDSWKYCKWIFSICINYYILLFGNFSNFD